MEAEAVSTLQDNLDALSPSTRATIQSATLDDVDLDLSGQMSASVRTPDGRWIRLHSAHDPIAEAERLLDAVIPGALPPTVFVLGAGLGYTLDAIERRRAGTRVIAIEPIAGIARAMLERRDWRESMASGRLTLLVGPEYAGASDAWKLVDAQAPAPAIVEHPVLARGFGADIAHARNIAETAIAGAQANDEARKKFAGRYLRNTLDNLPAICGEADVATLFDLFPGMPAIVVAAGPSLDHNLDALRALQGRALLIAVDTALRPLLAAGIRPHLAVAVDPSEKNAEHLLDIADSAGTWLVAEGSLDPRVLPEFSGRTFAFKVSDHHPWPWLREHGTDRGTLRAWGSVLTTAFDLACRLGCDPIVFAGADLAYTGGALYCRNTVNEKYWRYLTDEARLESFRRYLSERPTIMAPDVNGGSVLTTPTFLQFRDWLVARATAIGHQRRIVNATGAGTLHGERIAQAELGAISLPSFAGRAREMRERLAAAWTDSAAAGRDAVRHLDRTLADHGLEGLPMDAWLAFAGETASAAQIHASVDRAWRTPPRITAQPKNVFGVPGWIATLKAAATGGLAPATQWQVSKDEGGTWSDIPDATAATYTFTMSRQDRGTRVRAMFTSSSGVAMSEAAVLTTASRGIVADFNGDGRPDVLWRDAVTSAQTIWDMDGLTRARERELDARETDPSWNVVGAGDFGGRGKPDLLWHNPTSGRACLWYMDGTACTGIAKLTPFESGPEWRMAGTADFNGDSTPDILLRNVDTGENAIWFMDNAVRRSIAVVTPETDLSWTIAGIGDFDGDGRPDILWRNARTGENRIWLMDGVTRREQCPLDDETDLDWSVVGVGDLNGDGRVDILWRNTATGALRVWFLDGTARKGLGHLGYR